jgi:hypothetical protein
MELNLPIISTCNYKLAALVELTVVDWGCSAVVDDSVAKDSLHAVVLVEVMIQYVLLHCIEFGLDDLI